MKRRTATPLLAGAWLLTLPGPVAGCSGGEPGPTAPRAGAAAASAGTAAPGAVSGEPRSVTLRFVNKTGGDVFLDVTHGMPLSIRGEQGELARARHCRGACGEGCGCRECHPAPPLVRAIRDGEAFDLEWRGEHIVPGRCEGQGDTVCDCDDERMASPGRYEFSLRGSRAMTPTRAKPAGDDPSVLAASPDPSRGSCTARGALRLGPGQTTYEVAFSCSKP